MRIWVVVPVRVRIRVSRDKPMNRAALRSLAETVSDLFDSASSGIDQDLGGFDIEAIKPQRSHLCRLLIAEFKARNFIARRHSKKKGTNHADISRIPPEV